MQECTRWWRGKHSTAWVKQEILIVRPALASSDPTVSSRHQEFSILWPNLVAGAPVSQGHLQSHMALHWHTIICRELSLIKAKQARHQERRTLSVVMCSLSLPLSLCSGRHPNSPGHKSSSPVSLSRTVSGRTLQTGLDITSRHVTSRHWSGRDIWGTTPHLIPHNSVSFNEFVKLSQRAINNIYNNYYLGTTLSMLSVISVSKYDQI